LFSSRLWQTTGCRQFNGFYFNPISIKINVESQTSIDPKDQKFISRVFHNKATAAPFEISKDISKIIDTRYLLDILGPAGLVFFILGIASILKNKNKLGYSHLFITVIILFSALTTIPPKTSFWLMSLSFYSLSFWGISSLSKNKYIPTLLVILILATFWYFAINWQMPMICNEIAFN